MPVMTAVRIDGHLINVLFAEEEIAGQVERMAKEIARSKPERLLIVPILKGSFVLSLNALATLRDNGLHDKFIPVVGLDWTF